LRTKLQLARPSVFYILYVLVRTQFCWNLKFLKFCILREITSAQVEITQLSANRIRIGCTAKNRLAGNDGLNSSFANELHSDQNPRWMPRCHPLRFSNHSPENQPPMQLMHESLQTQEGQSRCSRHHSFSASPQGTFTFQTSFFIKGRCSLSEPESPEKPGQSHQPAVLQETTKHGSAALPPA
jgi:hypothetical protein